MSNDPTIDVILPKVTAISSVFITAECPECMHPRDILFDESITLDKDFQAKNLSITVQCDLCYTHFEITEVINS